MKMYKVSQKHLREAVSILTDLIEEKKIFLGRNPGEVIEVYPKVVGYLNREGDNRIYVEGLGVTLLAFLMQETAAIQECADHIQCKRCTKESECSESFSQGIPDRAYGHSWSDKKLRKEAEDVLRFLRRKYPDLYIPEYEAGDRDLSWVDLLVDVSAYGDFWPTIGIVLPEGDCKDFCEGFE